MKTIRQHLSDFHSHAADHHKTMAALFRKAAEDHPDHGSHVLLGKAADAHDASAVFHGDCCKSLEVIDRGGAGDVRTGNLDGPSKALQSDVAPTPVRAFPPSAPSRVTAIPRTGQAVPAGVIGGAADSAFEKMFGSYSDAVEE